MCLLQSCCDRPLVFFQRLLGSCAAHMSREITQVCARQEVFLPLSYHRSLPHRYLLEGVVVCSVIDVAAQQVSASSYVNIVNVTLVVQFVFDRFC